MVRESSLIFLDLQLFIQSMSALASEGGFFIFFVFVRQPSEDFASLPAELFVVIFRKAFSTITCMCRKFKKMEK